MTTTDDRSAVTITHPLWCANYPDAGGRSRGECHDEHAGEHGGDDYRLDCGQAATYRVCVAVMASSEIAMGVALDRRPRVQFSLHARKAAVPPAATYLDATEVQRLGASFSSWRRPTWPSRSSTDDRRHRAVEQSAADVRPRPGTRRGLRLTATGPGPPRRHLHPAVPGRDDRRTSGRPWPAIPLVVVTADLTVDELMTATRSTGSSSRCAEPSSRGTTSDDVRRNSHRCPSEWPKGLTFHRGRTAAALGCVAGDCCRLVGAAAGNEAPAADSCPR